MLLHLLSKLNVPKCLPDAVILVNPPLLTPTRNCDLEPTNQITLQEETISCTNQTAAPKQEGIHGLMVAYELSTMKIYYRIHAMEEIILFPRKIKKHVVTSINNTFYGNFTYQPESVNLHTYSTVI